MSNPFANFLFDVPSFLIGFVAATVLWWFINALRPLLAQVRVEAAKRKEEAKSRTASGLEDNYRKMAFRQSQRSHIASALFSLDEVIQPVRLLAPPPSLEPGLPHFNDDVVSNVLPYLPNWPELAAAFDAPSLSLPQALSRGANLIITGQPGTGKTVALAHLVSQIVNRAPEAEHLHELIPFMVHVADLDLNPKKSEEILNALKDLIADEAPVFFAPRVPGFVDFAFQSGRAIFLIDGVDELPPDSIQEVAGYLKQLIKTYPKARIVTTALHEQTAGLVSLGLFPLAVMPWNAQQQDQFLNTWSELWDKYVAKEVWAQTELQQVDSFLLNTWLRIDNTGMTPLEYTLKVWGAYAGDIRGPRPVDAIATHIRRLTPTDTPLEALHILAIQSNLTASPLFDTRKGREWVKSFEPEEDVATETEETPTETMSEEANGEVSEPTAEQSPEEEPKKSGKDKKADKKKGKQQATPIAAPRTNLISKMISSGLLSAHRGNSTIRFAHPLISGYLAGQGLANFKNTGPLISQPHWTGKLTSARYLAAFGDATAVVDALLKEEDTLFARPTLTAARLLRDAPKQAPWRGKVMGALVQILQNSEQPLNLRGQAVAAFVASGDPAVGTLFRQLTALQSPDLRQLVALGSGAIHDDKSIDTLAALTQDFAPNVRQAAALALVAIGIPKALETAAHVLLSGDEETRRAVAEAFAGNTAEGHEALKDGASSQDILVRRAVVFGLARIRTPWALEMLQQMQVGDEQWVVRTAATQALEGLDNPDPRIPHYLTPPHETPWVIEFAGQHGMGVTPGQSAIDIFLLALKSEKVEEKMGAVSYLRYQTSEGVIAAFYGLLFGENYELRETVFTVLAEMAYNGVKMPSPKQYGLG